MNKDFALFRLLVVYGTLYHYFLLFVTVAFLFAGAFWLVRQERHKP